MWNWCSDKRICPDSGTSAMTHSRRHFIRRGLTLGTAFSSGLGLTSHGQSPLRILVLGGTGFIGPHIVRYAVARGHEVTIFTRGRRRLNLPEVEHLIGDRNDDHSALRGRSWDVILDNNTQDYRWVQTSTALLQDAARHYIFVSSISAYDIESFGYDNRQTPLWEPAVDEDFRRIAPPRGWRDGDDAQYGLMKSLAEDIVRDAFPGGNTVVRPGLIVGPGDQTDRFTYWPVRLDQGGMVLAPGNPDHATQIIDQRDLGEWIVRLAENRVSGDFNAAGPDYRMSMGSMLAAVGSVIDTDYSLSWIPASFLEEQGVSPWTDLPAWIPGDPLSFVNIERAVSNGLTFRPVAQTALDTLNWDKTRPAEQRQNRRAGLTRERERELLAAWAARSR